MTTTLGARTRNVPNPELQAGDKIVTTDGLLTLESDAEPSNADRAMVSVDVAAGTLYLAAAQSSSVLSAEVGSDELSEELLEAKGLPSHEIELFSLGMAIGRGRERGVADEDTIRWFCLADVDDLERLAHYTGTAASELAPNADTALAFIASYRDRA